MRFEVPQFIDVEDKIFGPFTWKQFIYMAGGGGALFILFISLPFIVFLFFAVPIGSLAAGLAFYQVNNRPFAILLEAITTYFGRSRLYLWRRDERRTPQAVAPIKAAQPYRVSPKNTITALSRRLELHSMIKEQP